MKNWIGLCLITLSTFTTAQALEVSCTANNKQASMKDGQIVVTGDEVAVPVTIKDGAFITTPQTWVVLDQSHFSVSLQNGNEFEKQTYLQMSFDDLTSTVYDLKPSLYMIEKNGIRFQCLVKEVQ